MRIVQLGMICLLVLGITGCSGNARRRTRIAAQITGGILPQPVKRIAVIPFDTSLGTKSKGKGRKLAAQYGKRLTGLGYTLIPVSQLGPAMDNQAVLLTPEFKTAVINASARMGIEGIVFGKVTERGDNQIIALTLFRTSNGGTVWSIIGENADAEMIIQRLSEEMQRVTPQKLQMLPIR